MNQPTPSISVKCLVNYSYDDAVEIGRLLPHLSDSLSGQPIPRKILETIIASPFHDQFIARTPDGTIVGTATLSIVAGISTGQSAWLEDFVVDPGHQGAGIGSQLWDAIIEWCALHSAVTLEFTSNPRRIGAHKFYKSRGAVIRETSYFKKTISLNQT